jgi:hypothetical protein
MEDEVGKVCRYSTAFLSELERCLINFSDTRTDGEKEIWFQSLNRIIESGSARDLLHVQLMP